MKKFILMFLPILIISCQPKTSSLEFNDGTQMSLSGEAVSFETINSEILRPHCFSCHTNVTSAKALSSWVTAGDPEKSAFFTEVESGSMPQNASPLSTKDLELIREYITSLKPSPTPSPTPTPAPTPTTTISYSEVKARILSPYGCTSCHSVGTEAKLGKWINTTTPSKSSFYTTTKSGSMPQGGSRVSVDDLSFILRYVTEYASVH